VSDRDDVERAVRSWLENAEPGDRFTGVLDDWVRIGRSLVVKGDTKVTSLDIRRLDVVELTPARALVALEATRELEHAHAFGSSLRQHVYDGPVTLARVGGEWKLVDLVEGGLVRSASVCIAQPPVAVEQAGLRFAVLGAHADTVQTSVALELENATEGVITVARAAAIELPDNRRCGAWYFGPERIPPRNRLTVLVATTQAVPELPARIVLELEVGRTAHRIPLELAPGRLTLAGEPETVRRTWRMRARESARSQSGPLAIGLAAGLLILMDAWTMLAFLLAAVSVVLLWRVVRAWSRFPRKRRLLPHAVFPLFLLFVSGAILLEGTLFGAGCGGSARARADEFMRAYLTRGPAAVAPHVWPPAERGLPHLPPLPRTTIDTIVRDGIIDAPDCPALVEDEDAHCVEYVNYGDFWGIARVTVYCTPNGWRVWDAEVY
jgi:hypothetical protein